MFTVYLKFKYKWVSCILGGNPTPTASGTWFPAHYQPGLVQPSCHFSQDQELPSTDRRKEAAIDVSALKYTAPLIPSAASAQSPESQVWFEIKHHCVLSLGRVTARPHLPLSLFLEVRLGDGKSLPRTMDFACQAPGGSSSERKGKGATEIEFRLVRGNRVEKAPQTCELQLFPAPREWRWFSWRDAGDHHMRSS